MLRYELKKILFRRGGLFLLLGLLLIEAVLLFFTEPYDRELENNRASYESYLAQVEGPLSEDSRSFLEEEMARLELNRVRMENLKNDYYLGKISEEAFRAQFDEYAPGEAVYTGFTKLFSQFIFVREDAARYFLYTGGWEVLLTHWQPDLLLLLVLILLLTPVFCEEYASGMDQMLRTQKRSSRFGVTVKVIAALLVTGLLAAMQQLFEVIYAAAVFGLPHGDYTLRSLITFGATTNDLTLWQALWLQFALKELGYLYGAVLILFLSVLLKKVSLTLTAGIVLLPLPYLAVQEMDAFLSVPGPWALAVGSVYLQSDEAMAYIPKIVLGSAAIIAAMLLFLHRRNANRNLLLLGCLCLMLTGCAREPQEKICYNSVDYCYYETEQYQVNMHYGDSTQVHFSLLDKRTGISLPFPLDALEGQTVSCGWSFYGEGNTLYYIKTTTLYDSPLADSSAASFDALVRLNLETTEEATLYQWNSDTRWFFGLLSRPSWEPAHVRLLFIHGQMLYFDYNGAVYRMSLNTGAYEIFSENRGSVDIGYDGQDFYWLDSYNRLNLTDLDSGQTRLIENVVADKFLLTPDGFYFLNRQDGKSLWLWDKETNTTRKISDQIAMTLRWRDDHLLLTTRDGACYYLTEDRQLLPTQ